MRWQTCLKIGGAILLTGCVSACGGGGSSSSSSITPVANKSLESNFGSEFAQIFDASSTAQAGHTRQWLRARAATRGPTGRLPLGADGLDLEPTRERQEHDAIEVASCSCLLRTRFCKTGLNAASQRS